MNQRIYIEAYCPELKKTSSFYLEDVLAVCPRLFKCDENLEDFAEVARVEFLDKRLFPRNRYYLVTNNGNVSLLFLERNSEKNEVYLSLPLPFGFGREVFRNNL